MARPLWFVKLLEKTFPNVKFIAKLTKIPVIGRLIDNFLFKDDDIIYLPKDNVIPVDVTVENQGDVVLPTSVFLLAFSISCSIVRTPVFFTVSSSRGFCS